MKVLMMLASILTVATGTFCLANSSVPFIAVAFAVGIAILILGIVELAVNRATVVNSYETENEVNVEGLTAVILGCVFLAGLIQDDAAIVAIFALWTTIEGLKAVSANGLQFRLNNEDTLTRIIGVIMTGFGVYMFCNSILFNIKVTFMIGVVLVMMGMNRFRVALAIEYKKPEFLTGNKEKLAEAKREEKDAMKRAKDAIKETKDIQRRIGKIQEDIAREESMLAKAEVGNRMKKNNQ